MRLKLKHICEYLLMTAFLISVWMPVARAVEQAAEVTLPAVEQQKPIPPGTVITVQNWEQYKDYFDTGTQWIMSGKYFWKAGLNDRIVVGAPAENIPLPSPYLSDTEKYGGQAKLKELADGGTVVENYTAGVPFPHPSGPHAGDEVMWNLWYRYVPMMEGTYHGWQAFSIDHHHSIRSETIMNIYWRFSHLSEKGEPIYVPQGQPYDYVEYQEVLSPEQSKYTVALQLFYRDPAKVQASYAYIPALRRPLRLSAAARCAPAFGLDNTIDDQRVGFNGPVPDMQATLVGLKRILVPTVVDASALPVSPIDNDTMKAWALSGPAPGWPPSTFKWAPRLVYVIDMSKIPSLRPGYCYGRKRAFVDAHNFAPRAIAIWDMNMKPWRTWPHISWGWLHVPHTNERYFGGASNVAISVYDVQLDHASIIFVGSGVTGDQFPKQYHDIGRYASPEGLLRVMQ